MEWLGQVLGSISLVAGGGLLFYSFFKNDEGMKLLKDFALFSLVIGALGTFSFLFSNTFFLTPLINFFSFIKTGISFFDFVLPVDLVFFYLSSLLSVLSVYWSFLVVNMVVGFFKNN